ncbi:hypothetical protein [Neoroseomonas rubea]|uniref:hypothetical protein n=1 Tax=Neoroseomonas rubea TaxID=2748666 RepID=UPI0018E03980|nr:hypothetical protein [Roseomonas rubea]
MFLSACGTTAAQRRASEFGQQFQTASATAMNCVQQVYEKPENAEVRRRTPLRIEELTDFHIRDRSRPRPNDGEMLATWDLDMQECYKQTRHQLEPVGQYILGWHDETTRQYNEARTQLLQGAVSWGEYNRRRQEIYTASNESLRQAQAQFNQELEAAHASEMRSRQIAAGIALILLGAAAGAAAGYAGGGYYPPTQNVSGYRRSDGTYVAPYIRTRPDSNPCNNFSSRC